MATCSNFQHNSFIYADYLQVQILQALIYSVWKSGKVPYLGLFLYLAEGNLLQVAAKHVAKHVANSHQFCAGELWSPYVFYFLSNSLYSDGTYI